MTRQPSFTVVGTLAILILSLASLTAASCAQRPSKLTSFVDLSNPDVAQIVRIARDFEAWNKAGDVEHIADIYSPDVIYMHAGMANLEGKAAVAQTYKDFFSSYTAQVNVNVQEVRVFGDMAFDRATFTTSVTPKSGGETSVMKGQVMEILRKEGGKWKSFRVMAHAEN